ncbi:hypothetical protein KP79_PYT11247 [Mizuhopecten yessoensis]|uniref:Integrase core domain-containing protein n=1 Tax=Mizuhopecten yessoensis TaxID=6573 RepID=A0A210PTU0_MIZYE|nr:hypothetical protein KP79_PYT11247 [Mizuhopecten yessoensis]
MRYEIESPLEEIVLKIIEQRAIRHIDLGYKSMWKHLISQCGIIVRQETVRIALEAKDPRGVELRSRNLLRRRRYISQCPSFIFHVDGYDKLKPFGIAIHGAIDGFSRKILWLKAGPSNNNPRVIARYCIACLKEMNDIPRMVRSDAGSENVIIRDIQVALRSFHHGNMSDENSFTVGRSTANQ